MYKARITNTEGADGWWIDNYKAGDIVRFADSRLRDVRRWVEVIEHYRMVTVSRKICKECGSVIVKREKKKLPF